LYVISQDGICMKIGKFVRHFIKPIFSEDTIEQLQDKEYSKEKFDINYPFCMEIERIKQEALGGRYWAKEYKVFSKKIRVTNDWYERNLMPFKRYLESKSIMVNIDDPSIADKGLKARRLNARYKGNAIGNAQNLFIRTILSNLGQESFNKNDWISTKNHFNNCCAYCGAVAGLQIDHAIPINKKHLGEHRLGNIVPSCNTCNSKKHSKDFKKFLEEINRFESIAKINDYMTNKGYKPLEESADISLILDKAHKEVADLAKKYITEINKILSKTNQQNQ